jgi:hypothetical protein
VAAEATLALVAPASADEVQRRAASASIVIVAVVRLQRGAALLALEPEVPRRILLLLSDDDGDLDICLSLSSSIGGASGCACCVRSCVALRCAVLCSTPHGSPVAAVQHVGQICFFFLFVVTYTT